MNGELFSFLVMGVLFAILIWGIVKQNKQVQEAKQELRKLVQQAGGQNIVIWRDDKWGQRGFIQFVLLYTDSQGAKHKHLVTRHWKLWVGFQDEYFWDTPLQRSTFITPIGSQSSKEQIISEMDAEIKRLQEELHRAREEG